MFLYEKFNNPLKALIASVLNTTETHQFFNISITLALHSRNYYTILNKHNGAIKALIRYGFGKKPGNKFKKTNWINYFNLTYFS